MLVLYLGHIKLLTCSLLCAAARDTRWHNGCRGQHGYVDSMTSLLCSPPAQAGMKACCRTSSVEVLLEGPKNLLPSSSL